MPGTVSSWTVPSRALLNIAISLLSGNETHEDNTKDSRFGVMQLASIFPTCWALRESPSGFPRTNPAWSGRFYMEGHGYRIFRLAMIIIGKAAHTCWSQCSCGTWCPGSHTLSRQIVVPPWSPDGWAAMLGITRQWRCWPGSPFFPTCQISAELLKGFLQGCGGMQCYRGMGQSIPGCGGALVGNQALGHHCKESHCPSWLRPCFILGSPS